MKKLPVNIISGFLGSGKTTLIIELFKQKPKNENWVILINEFGEQSIDAITLSRKTTANKILEIHGGCICCTSVDFFEQSLKEISKNEKLDRLIIEPTGLGGLETIKNCIENFPNFNLYPIICLLENGIESNVRITTNGIFLDQLRHADILAVSKCDTLSEKYETTMNWLKSTFMGKQCYLFLSRHKIDTDLLNTNLTVKKNTKKTPNTATVYINPKEKFNTSTLIFKPDIVFNYNLLHSEIEKQKNIQRIKGYLKTDLGWIFVNNSENSRSFEKCTSANNMNAITFIYSDQRIKEEVLRASLKNCII